MSFIAGHGSRGTLFLFLLLALATAGCGGSEPATEAGPPKARVETCRDLILLLDHAVLEHDGPGKSEARIEERLVSMGGPERAAIFAHPVSEISYTLAIHPGARLEFLIGMHPDCWETATDGATFEVLVRTTLGSETLFSRHLDPVHRPKHQEWKRCEVDLQQFAGTTREIVLRTGPGPADDPAFDWALWGEPRLISEGRRVPAETSARPHVILISLDTLRLDHLDASGHQRLTTPHLNRLLEESLFFTNAHAPSHWTMPSHMSVFTSLPPDIHQVFQIDGTARLAEGIPTLAGQLRKAGYLTAGFASCGFIKGDLGFDRGFDRYFLRYNNARRQNRLIRDWAWSNRDRDQFIFLHYFDAHSDHLKLPYTAPHGFEDLWSDLESEEIFGGCSPDGELCASSYLTHLNTDNVQLKLAERQAIGVMYDRGIRQLDYSLAKLVAWLKAQGLWDSSLVVLFSDHGEEFQEHGKMLHQQLYNELIAVPLIIKLPGGNHGGRRIDTPVEAIDVAPTILSLLELPVPEIMQGRSLAPLIGEGAATPDKDPLIFSWARNSSSITQGEWKLVTGTFGGREALFNLSTDPGERHNLIRRENHIARQLHQLLKEQRHRNRAIADRMSASGPAPTDGFSDEERKKLELLGYVE